MAAATTSSFVAHSTQRGNLGALGASLSGAGSSTLTLDPVDDLFPGETVTVTLTPDITSEDGGTLSEGYVWQFTGEVAESSPGIFGNLQYDASSDAHNTQATVFSDVDGDGHLDLVVGNYSDVIRLHWGDGTGGFSAGANITSDKHRTWSMITGDIDADGDTDIIAGNDTQINRLYKDDGSGSFNSGVDITNDALNTHQMALGDVDADGTLDLVTGNWNHLNRLYIGSGSGGFSQGISVTSDIYRTTGIALEILTVMVIWTLSQ